MLSPSLVRFRRLGHSRLRSITLSRGSSAGVCALGPLPKESQLAEQLGISRPTLRQGLHVLQDAGFLRVKPGKGGGIFISSDLVPTAEISRGIALEEEAVIETLHARRVLEGATTFAAMQFATEEDFDEIEHTVSLTREHLGDRVAVMKTDAMFHRAVVRACRKSY